MSELKKLMLVIDLEVAFAGLPTILPSPANLCISAHLLPSARNSIRLSWKIAVNTASGSARSLTTFSSVTPVFKLPKRALASAAFNTTSENLMMMFGSARAQKIERKGNFYAKSQNILKSEFFFEWTLFMGFWSKKVNYSEKQGPRSNFEKEIQRPSILFNKWIFETKYSS